MKTYPESNLKGDRGFNFSCEKYAVERSISPEGKILLRKSTPKTTTIDMSVDMDIGKDTNGYFLERKIGRGAYSSIYKAFDMKRERKVAIKVSDVSEKAKDSDLAFNEVEIYKKLCERNPSSNVVAYYDHFIRENKNLYLVMEYAKFDLSTLINRREDVSGKPPIELRDKIEIAYQISDAVEFLHSRSVAHRDLKPENVVICSGPGEIRGIMKLCDFGFAVVYDKKSPPTEYIGSPDYMPPEIIRCLKSPKPYGLSCDLWSLGITIYEIFVGEPTFYDENLRETMFNILMYNDTIVYPQGKVPPMQVCRFLKNLILQRPEMRVLQPEILKADQ